MKRRLMGLLGLLAALFCAAACASAQTPSMSIADLKAQTPENWEANGINVPVYVPDVTEMPVLEVTRRTLSDAALEEYGAHVRQNSKQAQRIQVEPQQEEAEGIARITNAIYNPLWEARFNAELYAENQTVSLEEALERLGELTEKAFGGMRCLPRRAQVFSADKRFKGSEVIPVEGGKPGYYCIDVWPMLRGIPVLQGVAGGRRARGAFKPTDFYTALSRYSAYFVYRSEEDWIWSSAGVFEETGVKIEDIPLCSFETIRDQLEAMIESGELRRVYDMKLGYVIYADPDVRYAKKLSELLEQRYVAVPTWICEVSQSRSGTTGRRTTEYATPEPDIHGSVSDERGLDWGYEIYQFNAQTGELYSLYDYENSKLYMPEVATWKEAGEPR
ncbi:MAG: hypothetical protein Q4G52_01425 [Clostridia bacterium]|nr:hypothetical protein [Clostridia bacterium]